MNIPLYILSLIICTGIVVGLYFLLRNKSEKTQKIVLFSILIFSVILHFLKSLFPPYSTDMDRMLRDSWFINICGANIALYPFFYISKSKSAKDYMFYLGCLGGLIAIIYPMEVLVKANPYGEVLDVLRFYWHHLMLFAVPLLMLLFKHHTLSYKRILYMPLWLLAVCAFCMLNQVLQSELGFIPMRGNDIIEPNYKNSSLIWAPPDIGFFRFLVPEFMRTIPYGVNAGEAKYWPLLWAVVPLYVIFVPLCFLLCMIFDFKNIKNDFKNFFARFKKRNN